MTRSLRTLSSLGLLIAASACDASSSQGGAGSEASSLGASVDALASAVAACGKERRACKEADGSAPLSCEDTFTACKDGALTAAAPELEKGAKACRSEFKSCRDGATDAGISVCKEDLKACVAEDRGDQGKGKPADGGAQSASKNANAECVSSLRECLEGDLPNKECSDELRACLAQSMASEEHGKPERADGDGGKGKPDDATDAARGKPEGVGGGKPDTASDSDAGVPGKAMGGGKKDEVGGGKPNAQRAT